MRSPGRSLGPETDSCCGRVPILLGTSLLRLDALTCASSMALAAARAPIMVVTSAKGDVVAADVGGGVISGVRDAGVLDWCISRVSTPSEVVERVCVAAGVRA